MLMSRQASRPARDSGAVAPDASRHELFTADGQARGAGSAAPARSGVSGSVPPVRSHRCPASHGRQPNSRTRTADVEGPAR
jgi:hypothetical protein